MAIGEVIDPAAVDLDIWVGAGEACALAGDGAGRKSISGGTP
jgi:hypothetical protein